MLEALRCPAAHPPAPLIAAVTRRAGDDVRDATLGCPTCHAEYTVTDGVARFGTMVAPPAGARPDDEALMRAGALLGLVAPGGNVALAPAWAEYAHPLVALTDVSAVVVGPPPGFTTGDGVSAIAGVQRLPVAAATFRGVALDSWIASAPDAVMSWLAACKPKARVVAPAAVPVPEGVELLARDAQHWVGERRADGWTTPVALQRGARA